MKEKKWSRDFKKNAIELLIISKILDIGTIAQATGLTKKEIERLR